MATQSGLTWRRRKTTACDLTPAEFRVANHLPADAAAALFAKAVSDLTSRDRLCQGRCHAGHSSARFRTAMSPSTFFMIKEILRLQKNIGFTLLSVTPDCEGAFEISTRVVIRGIRSRETE
jgi:hypothetical protein